jgi:hypothetical protein
MARLFASLLICGLCSSISNGFPLPKPREPSYPEPAVQDPCELIQVGMTIERVVQLTAKQPNVLSDVGVQSSIFFLDSGISVFFSEGRVISVKKRGR